MNDIFVKQNTEESLLRLRAQGHLYDSAKSYKATIVWCSVFVVAICALICSFYPQSIALQYFSVIYGAAVSVIAFILEYLRSSKKNFAARVQQLLDSELFGMKWEKIWGAKPTLDEIQDAAANEPVDRYIDWYDKAIEQVDKMRAITVCFRININYDGKLRTMYMQRCHILFWSFIALLIIFALVTRISVATFLYNIIIPALPIILLYVKTWIEEKDDTNTLEKIRDEVDKIQDSLKNGRHVAHKDLVTIQTMILKHRESCFDIPSYFYKKHRTETEESIHEFAQRLVDEIQ